MTYLVTPLSVGLDTLTDTQITDLSTAFSGVDLVIVGTGFDSESAALIIHATGTPGAMLLDEIKIAVKAVDLTPGETEVMTDAVYEARLFAPTTEES